MGLQIVSDFTDIEIIAKGTARVRLPDGVVCRAEVHWYEAHGVGKREIKVKRLLDESE